MLCDKAAFALEPMLCNLPSASSTPVHCPRTLKETAVAPGSLLFAALLKFSPSPLIFCLYYWIIEFHIHLSLKD